MISSMTGFGRADSSDGIHSYSVEIRSVNSRYLETSFRISNGLSEHEAEFKNRLSKHIKRGKVFIGIKIERENIPRNVVFKPDQFEKFRSIWSDIATHLKVENSPEVKDFLPFIEQFTEQEELEEDPKILLESALSVFDEALMDFTRQRQAEGKNLAEDMRGRLLELDDLLSGIESVARDRVMTARKKLSDRLQVLLNSDDIDAERLEMEMAIIADKLDITEEIVRLKSHISFFKQSLQQNEPVGRKLNFLVQEMNREVNTIGSKANDADIAQTVVAMKELLEQLREQIQNLE